MSEFITGLERKFKEDRDVIEAKLIEVHRHEFQCRGCRDGPVLLTWQNRMLTYGIAMLSLTTI
jgi:hypothetical protein